ncbi:hypothetical protein D3C81_1714440 [compost metagenome]
MAGLGRGEQRGKGFVPLLGSVEVRDEARGLSRVFAIGEPIAQQGIASNVGRSHQRLAEHTLDVVTDGFDTGWQRCVDQVAFGQAVERHRENDHHHQDARQQGRAHACDQLPLDASPPDTHALAPRQLLFCGKCIHLRIQLFQ